MPPSAVTRSDTRTPDDLGSKRGRRTERGESASRFHLDPLEGRLAGTDDFGRGGDLAEPTASAEEMPSFAFPASLAETSRCPCQRSNRAWTASGRPPCRG